MQIFNIIFIAIIVLSLLTASIVSYFENEYFAFKRFFFFSLGMVILYASLFLVESKIGLPLIFIVNLTMFVIVMILFLPIDKRFRNNNIYPDSKIDERDTMFSRAELIEDTQKFYDYYKLRPNNISLDNKFRNQPGLLNKNASKYNPISFAAADASFFTVSCFKDYTDGNVSSDKIDIESREITKFIKKWAKNNGAVGVAITTMKDYHFYSIKGRGEHYGEEVKNNHKFGIAFIFEMDKTLIDTAPDGPTVMESAQQYLNSGVIAVQVANFIRRLGYSAKSHIDGNYDVVCPLVARDAGLGEIGRMGLLITPKYGPRVRISVVTTDIPLIIDSSKQNHSVFDFCHICKKCANNCPAQAIPAEGRSFINGAYRWQINSEKCYTYWCKVGTDCGRCIKVCPYAHPNNILHNMVRFGIKNNYLFRRVALKLDDIFYGKKPQKGEPYQWLKIEGQKVRKSKS